MGRPAIYVPTKLDEEKEAWCEFLSFGKEFLTVTFREPRRSWQAESTVHGVLRTLFALGYPRGFLGVELHYLGTIHLHGLLPRHPLGLPLGMTWSVLFERYGRSRLEECRSRDDVAEYVTKYVLKALTYYQVW